MYLVCVAHWHSCCRCPNRLPSSRSSSRSRSAVCSCLRCCKGCSFPLFFCNLQSFLMLLCTIQSRSIHSKGACTDSSAANYPYAARLQSSVFAGKLMHSFGRHLAAEHQNERPQGWMCWRRRGGGEREGKANRHQGAADRWRSSHLEQLRSAWFAGLQVVKASQLAHEEGLHGVDLTRHPAP